MKIRAKKFPKMFFFLFLCTRSFFHMFLAGSIYYLVASRVEVSMIGFVAGVVLIAVAIEYYQNVKKVADDINPYVFSRDIALVVLILTNLVAVYILREIVSPQIIQIMILITLVLISSIFALAEKKKPQGRHLFYKSYLDVFAYATGPLIFFPLLVKITQG